jgi:hypothetical protein
MSSHSQQDERNQRREAEIALLLAMYPSDITWHEQRREIIYKPETGGSLILRIPDDYPGEFQPTIIEALDRNKDEIRDIVRKRIDGLGLSTGEEILDAIIQAFDEITSELQEALEESNVANDNSKDPGSNNTYKTMIVWLHHLLNTNKRKLALTPSINMGQLSGITKPGYPGILVYSGTTAAVDTHVSELKNQRWQAFQVRLEEVSENVWEFSHGSGIKELESMSEATQSILSQDNREAFLKAVGIK